MTYLAFRVYICHCFGDKFCYSQNKNLLSNYKYELWKRRHTLLLLEYVSLNKRFMLRVKLTVLLQTAISLQTSERSLQYRKISQT
jgi:hypothetical protein